MLFSAMACFSPSVPAFVRRAWVQNGGRLTHTDEDFRKADYFFCIGMDDPWLHELRSRLLIVRHVSWVMKSVSNNFLMPIASFTLDANFDPSKVEPLIDKQAVSPEQTMFSTPHANKQTLSSPPDDMNVPVRNLLVKRPIDTLKTASLPRGRKRARIGRSSLEDICTVASSITYKVMPSGRLEDGLTHSHSSIPSVSTKVPHIVFKKVPMKDRRLKRSGSFEPVVVPFPTKPKAQRQKMPKQDIDRFQRALRDACAEHALSGSFKLFIDDLLDASHANCTVFKLGAVYRDKKFNFQPRDKL